MVVEPSVSSGPAVPSEPGPASGATPAPLGAGAAVTVLYHISSRSFLSDGDTYVEVGDSVCLEDGSGDDRGG